MISVNIAVEDDLSEAVLRRLLSVASQPFCVSNRFPLPVLAGGRTNPRNVDERRGLSGYGQVKVNLAAFNNAARVRPFVVLTDLDVHAQCPGELLPSWLSGQAPSPNLVFRVAVYEVEAWLLADRDNFSFCVGISEKDIPFAVEAVRDPKAEIVELARNSRHSDVVDDLVPVSGSRARVGRRFNPWLINFAKYHWDVTRAASNCRSLERAVMALDRFSPS